MTFLRPLLILIGLVLVACDTPKVGFKYDGLRELSVGGNDYKVFYNKTQAQAVRLNNVGLRQRQVAIDHGVQAISMASGCEVGRINPKTDPSLIIARIKC